MKAFTGQLLVLCMVPVLALAEDVPDRGVIGLWSLRQSQGGIPLVVQERHPTKEPVPVTVVTTRRLVPEEYSDIQEAIDAALDGDTVLVRDGTYLENILFDGKKITVASYYLLDEDTAHITNTVIDGSQPADPLIGSTVLFVSAEDTNSVLTGFTVTGGSGTFVSDFGVRGGGGVICLSTGGGRISHNRIVNNNVSDSVTVLGGGIATGPPGSGAFVIIENNTIADNTATSSSSVAIGGGVSLSTAGRITGDTISGNRATSGLESTEATVGGGLYAAQVSVLISSNIIQRNTLNVPDNSWGSGGGIAMILLNPGSSFHNNMVDSNYTSSGSMYGAGVWASGTNLPMYNNIISRNRGSFGGGVRVRSSACLVNNTIAANNATVSGGGISLSSFSPTDTMKVINTIVWGNGGGTLDVAAGIVEALYSDLEGGWAGEGNLDSDPLFVSEYRLDSTSSCIEAGVDSVEIGEDWYYAPGSDFGGFARPMPVGTRPDMGAWENPVSIVQDVAGDNQFPLSFSLFQNYPNPFNPETVIRYGIPERTHVRLEVFNLLGQGVLLLSDGLQERGYHSVVLDAGGMPSGVYFYRIQAGSFGETRKLMLLK